MYSHTIFVEQINKQDIVIQLGALTPKQRLTFQHVQALVSDILNQTTRKYPSESRIQTLRNNLTEQMEVLQETSKEINLILNTITNDQILAQSLEFETDLLDKFKQHVNTVITGDITALIVDFRKLLVENMQFGKLVDAYDKNLETALVAMTSSVITMRKTNTTITSLILFTIICEGVFIFWPLIRRLQSEYSQSLTSQKHLHYQALHDELTGLGNRKFFNEILENKLRNINSVFMLAILDLDNFKKINDKHGHLEGDWCLQMVAQSLQKNLRQDDQIARLGGEEFVVLFDGADVKTLRQIMERIQREVLLEARKKINDIPIGFSYGFSCYPKDAQDFNTLISIADGNMYHDKIADN